MTKFTMKTQLFCLAVVASSLSAPAESITGLLKTEPILIPGLTNVQISNIANDGTLLGYVSDDQGGNLRGFVSKGSDVTLLPVPSGTTDLQTWGANLQGTIVGELDYTSGFILKGTEFTRVDYPAEGVTETLLTGINDSGLMTGTAFGDAGPFAFTLQDTNFTLIEIPGASRSFAYDVNNRNVVVGQYRQGAGDTFGFWKRGTNAHVALQVPGADRTIAYGVNNDDVIVGAYRLPNETNFRGFIYEAGIYTLLDFPGATWTVPSDLNDQGVIVGYYRDGQGDTHPFRAVRTMPKVRHPITTIDVPGKAHTLAFGINDRGEVVGQWYSEGFAQSGGFRRDAGGRYYLFPAPPGYDGITPQAINNSGSIVGQTYPDGFILSGGISRSITLADHSEVFLRALNDSGVFGGNAVGDFGDVPVISLDGTNLVVVPLPDYTAAGVSAIANNGTLGGYRQQTVRVDGTENTFTSGFILSGSKTTTIRTPRSSYSSVDGIYSRGTIMGAFISRTSGNALRSFLLQDGEFSEIELVFDRPGSGRASISARNDAGLIVGFYRDASGAYHSYLARPEASTLSVGHGDLDYSFTTDQGLVPSLRHDTQGSSQIVEETFLQVSAAAHAVVPQNSDFAFLGGVGAPIWTLGQTQKEGILFFGLSAENIGEGVFQDDSFSLFLRDFSGPGDFFLYTIDGFGKPHVDINTADGVNASDRRTMPVGSHLHMNWSFTAPGIYQLSFEAQGILTNGVTVSSGRRTLTFLVEPSIPVQPVLAIAKAPTNHIAVSWAGSVGTTYQLQSTTNLLNGWVDLGLPIVSTAGPLQVHHSVLGDQSRFLRLRTEPTLPSRGQIIFHVYSADFTKADLWLVHPDGSGLRQITSDPAEEIYPRWSPDGTRIVYNKRIAPGILGIMVMNADGTGSRLISPSSQSCVKPSWSPDGSQFAFHSTASGNTDLWVINADGTSLRRLTTDGGSDRDPVWSPDGLKIAFRSNRSGANHVCTINPDGSGFTDLTPDGEAINPAWSPDGNKLAFHGKRGTPLPELFVMNTDGSGVTQVTSNTTEDYTAGWSPNGLELVFNRVAGGTSAIYIIGVNGANERRLGTIVPNDTLADWK